MKAPPRLQRMLLQLQPYNFDLKYRPGKEVVIADTLSCLSPHDQEPIPELEVRIHHMMTVNPPRMEELQMATEEDEELQLLKRQIISGWPAYFKEIATPIKAYWSMRDDLYIQDGLVMMGQRIIIPSTKRNMILEKIHTGHLGIEKCKLRAKSAVWWPGIYPAIEKLVSKCPSCQTHQTKQTREPMISIKPPPWPWHTIGGDLFHFDNKWYLIVTDYFSKFTFVRRLISCKTSQIQSGWE